MLHTARLELALATQQAEQGAASRTALRSLPKLADPALRVDALAALAAFEFSTGDETFEKTLAALEVERERLPHSDTRRVSTAAMIADLRVSSTLGRGDQSKNMALIADTLKDAERYFPPQHPAIARLRKKLAVLYLLQDKTAESAVLLDRVLQDDRTIYGEDSTVTGQTLRFMAQVHQLLGNYALFEKYARSALAIFEGKPSADKTDLATAREYIADLALNRGEYAEARAGYQAAYEAQLADGTHSGTELFKRLKIALAHKLAGDKAAAEKLYSEVATQARAGSAAQAVAWIGQGDLARAAGDPARAADLHRKAADQLERRAMAPGAPLYRLWALQQLAADLRDMNRSQESEDILDQVVAALDKKFPYNHPYLTDAYLAQGQSILRTGGDRAEGKRLIERCLALRMQIYGAAHPDTRRARAALDAAGRRRLIADGAK